MRKLQLISSYSVFLVLAFLPRGLGQESGAIAKDAAKPNRFLRFANRAHVELKGTKGLLNLNGSFTVEAWLRWDGAITTPLYLMGDEIWKDMAAELPKVPRAAGWVLRTSPTEDGDKQRLDFTAGAQGPGIAEWFSVLTPLQKKPDREIWQHVAVCKTPETISIFWNGKLSAQKSCRWLRFYAAPTDLYLGVRRAAHEARSFAG